MPEIRIVGCEHCGTEGTLYSGTRKVEIEVEPVTLDDLEEVA